MNKSLPVTTIPPPDPEQDVGLLRPGGVWGVLAPLTCFVSVGLELLALVLLSLLKPEPPWYVWIVVPALMWQIPWWFFFIGRWIALGAAPIKGCLPRERRVRRGVDGSRRMFQEGGRNVR